MRTSIALSTAAITLTLAVTSLAQALPGERGIRVPDMTSRPGAVAPRIQAVKPQPAPPTVIQTGIGTGPTTPSTPSTPNGGNGYSGGQAQGAGYGPGGYPQYPGPNVPLPPQGTYYANPYGYYDYNSPQNPYGYSQNQGYYNNGGYNNGYNGGYYQTSPPAGNR